MKLKFLTSGDKFDVKCCMVFPSDCNSLLVKSTGLRFKTFARYFYSPQNKASNCFSKELQFSAYYTHADKKT